MLLRIDDGNTPPIGLFVPAGARTSFAAVRFEEGLQMNYPQVRVEDLKELYEAARFFGEMRPWDLLETESVYRIGEPSSGAV